MALKILGTGLGRTGTSSLQIALEHLEGESCFHMRELMSNHKRVRVLKAGDKSSNYDWEALFEGYTMSVDYPICLFYKELMAAYPDLKIIHTVRDPERWYYSVMATIYRSKPKTAGDFLRLFKNLIFSQDMRNMTPVFMYADELIWKGQFQGKFEEKEFAIRMYEQHTEAVKAFVPQEKLLIFNVQDGWKPLCDFLGHSVPDFDFPRANSEAEFNQQMDRLLIDGVLEM